MASPLIISFTAYLLFILLISVRAYRRTHDLADYILGGRKLSTVVTALSVGASDMSAWLLLGLPGAIFVSGLSAAWIGVGLLLGAYCNWSIVAKPLRLYSVQAQNSLTLPDYFENRFNDKSRLLRIISALVILLFFTFYTASGLVGGAILFVNSFGLDYFTALGIGAFIIVSYTLIGGFLAVSWTDALQAMLMLAALIYAPWAVFSELGGVSVTWQNMQAIRPNSVNLFDGMTAMALLSLLAWGLGYMGQPHILARFMAIKNPQKIATSRRLAMSWMSVVLMGSVLTGLAGIAYFGEQGLIDPETVFIALSQQLFNPWVAGLITAAILSAIMSTIDSQLLVCSSVIAEDVYRVFLRPSASNTELLLVGRMAVVGIALVALLIASNRDSSVLDLVSYAWAGFGAAFGPVIIFSLLWRKMTALAALLAMLTGAITVLVFAQLSGGIFDVYELLPGFVLASLVLVLVSHFRPQSDKQVLSQFDAYRELMAAKAD